MSQQSARDRAIAAFNSAANPQGNIQTAPVQNPNQVAPEEMTALKAPEAKKAPETPTKTEASEGKKDGQDTNSEVTKPKADDPLSQQYALLARKEKALRQKVQEFKANEDAIKAREAAIAAKEAEFQSKVADPAKYVSVEDFRKNPIGTLNKLGITYDQLAQEALNQPSQENVALLNEIAALKDELKSIRSEQETQTKARVEEKDRSYKQAVAQIRNETQKLVETDETYEMIKSTGAVNDVVELIEKTFQQDGVLLTVEEAALQVENYLVDEAIKLAQAKKIQAKLAPKSEPKPEPTKEVKTDEQQSAKTLTNTMTTSKPLTARERAVLAFEGKLK